MESTCPNCAHPSAGRYCPACGQDNARARLDSRAVVLSTVQNLVGVDSALVRTLRGLVRDPGGLGREYIGGRRRRFVNPARFCLLSLALWFFVGRLFGFDALEATGMNVSSNTGDAETKRRIADFTFQLAKYLDLLMYLSLPVFAVFLRLASRRTGRNLAEVLVLVLYVEGVHFLIAVVLLPVQFAVHGTSLSALPQVIRFAVYTAFALRAIRGFFGFTWRGAAWRFAVCKAGHVLVLVLALITLLIAWIGTTGSAG